MTTRAVLRIPRPLSHQRPILDSASPRKLWRAGRRVGKSVAGRIAGVRGHGPLVNGKRLLRGMVDGANVAWVTKTYKQSKAIWRKLLRMFGPIEGTVVEIDREDKRIGMLVGRGAIIVWSGHTRDALDNLRGDAYDGIILDEAAYVDAEYAIQYVLSATLLDSGGWLFVFSTPNAGWDGNETRQVPSYFNRLCQSVLDGHGGPWVQWHNRTEDNPRLKAEAVAELRASVPEDSPTAQQELDALLVAGGLLALTIDRARVLVDPFERPAHWTLFAAFDWGYSHPYSFQLFVANEGGEVWLWDAVSGRGQEPDIIAQTVRKLLTAHGLTFKSLRYTAAGHDCWDDVKARGHRGPTIEEQFRACGWYLTRANIDRVQGVNNIRHYLKTNRFRVVRRVSTLPVLKCLETRITDPKDPEDVFRTPADQNGRGGDDEYDCSRYGLMSRPALAKAPEQPLKQGQVNRAALKARTQAPSKPQPGAQAKPTRSPAFRPGLVAR